MSHAPPQGVPGKKKTHSRRQAHQNTFKYYHNPNSSLTRKIMSIDHEGLCRRCEQIIEWRKTYRKYKPLSQPSKCTSCLEKTVTRAYHSLCLPCSRAKGLCGKCQQPCEAASRPIEITDEEVLEALEKSAIKLRTRNTLMRNWEKGLLKSEDVMTLIHASATGEDIDWRMYKTEEGQEEQGEGDAGEEEAGNEEKKATGKSEERKSAKAVPSTSTSSKQLAESTGSDDSTTVNKTVPTSVKAHPALSSSSPLPSAATEGTVDGSMVPQVPKKKIQILTATARKALGGGNSSTPIVAQNADADTSAAAPDANDGSSATTSGPKRRIIRIIKRVPKKPGKNAKPNGSSVSQSDANNRNDSIEGQSGDGETDVLSEALNQVNISGS